MKILLLGGNGFIGRRLAARLIEAGHELSAPSRVELDLARPNQDWAAWVDGVDAVANLAGAFRQGRAGGFEAIHHAGPLRLAALARAHGVRRWVQLSALGAAAHAARRSCPARAEAMPLCWIVAWRLSSPGPR